MKKIFLGLMACAALCACTNDDVALNGPQTSEVTDPVYMKLNLAMSTVGTRSTTTSTVTDDYGTSSTGVEYGQDSENAVSNVLVMLTTGTAGSSGETLVASATASTSGGDLTAVGDGTTYVVEFESDALSSALGQNVNVYVYCNPSSSLATDKFDADAAYTLGSVTSEEPWTSGAIFMSNAKAYAATIPLDLSNYKTAANPFDLGVVEVERSVARFDYKDGATGGTAYTYALTEDGSISVELQEVALINMSNSFYYLRRVAATGTTDGVADYTNTTLLGVETSTNWVIDTDAAAKASYAGTGLASNFTYGLESPTTWEWTKFSAMTTADNDNTWNSGSTYGDYYIWRYATENTIPAIAAQKNGISTGVVFKGQLVETGTSGLLDGENVIYVYENVLYGSWDKVKTAAEADPTSSLGIAYQEVMDVWTGSATERSDAVKAAMAAAGFTGYTPNSAGEYYVYYYYWNRHNDNSQDGVMGVMEFAVVRNNVYKLSVTEIAKFGHPSPTDPDDPTNPNPDPDPDPDPVDPDEPDESENIYLKVEVEILPWVVRVNDITF